MIYDMEYGESRSEVVNWLIWKQFYVSHISRLRYLSGYKTGFFGPLE